MEYFDSTLGIHLSAISCRETITLHSGRSYQWDWVGDSPYCELGTSFFYDEDRNHDMILPIAINLLMPGMCIVINGWLLRIESIIDDGNAILFYRIN